VAEPIATLRDGTEVAAWMFKANPEVWDVLGAIRHGEPIDSWPMVSSYRVDLVAPGQPCALWVTGGRGAKTTGLWGRGVITGEPYWEVVERKPDEPKPWVEFEMEFLDDAIPLLELASDERFARAEIIRAPRVSSPVALTAEQLSAIDDAWLDHRPRD
jgi:hypothetical protein